MKYQIKRIAFVLLFLFIIISACATHQPVTEPEAGYEKEAIHLTFRSDPKLNFHGNMPHPLLICVYQLKDPNAFNQLAGDEDGLYELLECSLFDPGIYSSKRLTVHPGQDLEVLLDRAADARYVSVVAGYYLIEKERIARMFEIPVVSERRGIFFKTYYKLGRLEVEMMLGPKQIHSVHSEEGSE